MSDFQDFGPLQDRGRARAGDPFPRAIPPRRPAAADRPYREALHTNATIRRRRVHRQPDPIPELLTLAVLLLIFAVVAAILIGANP